MPPEWDVNLFNMRVGGRGVGGDVAAMRGCSAAPRLFSFLFVCPHRGWWVGVVRISGQGPDQTIQESEIYKK